MPRHGEDGVLDGDPSTWPDEWEPWLENALRNPEFAAAYRAAEAELALTESSGG